MTAVYLAAFVVGGIAVLAALLLTEFSFGDIGAGHGIGHGANPDSMPFLSLTSLSAGILGAGTGGLIGEWAGLGDLGAGLIAIISAVALIALLQGVLMPYLRRQQSNSQRGRDSYVGLLGTVTLDVPTDGWGEVAFVDGEGNRVRARAVTAEPETLIKATRVYIAEVDKDFVHVVAVPDIPAVPDSPA